MNPNSKLPTTLELKVSVIEKRKMMTGVAVMTHYTSNINSSYLKNVIRTEVRGVVRA